MITAYQIIKIFHFLGFIVAIGTTVASAVAYRYFWRQYKLDHTRVKSIFQLIQGVQIAGMIGMVTLLIAGITMLSIVHGAFTSVLWFQIKLGLIVLIFANGLTLGRTTAKGLKNLVEQSDAPQDQAVEALRLKSNATLFSAVQLTIFSLIVILSILKIN